MTKYIRACVRILHTGLSNCYLKALFCVCVCVCVHAHIQSSSDGLMQGRLVIPYRRSGTTYRSHFEGSSTPTTQKSTDLICTEAEAWSHAQLQPIRNFSARRGWVVSTTPQPLYPRGKTRYPMCMCVCVCVCMYVCVCIYIYIYMYNYICRSQWPRGLRRRSAAARLLRSWVRIPPGGHECLFVVSVVCCQVEVSATSWSLVQRSPTDCGVLLCVI